MKANLDFSEKKNQILKTAANYTQAQGLHLIAEKLRKFLQTCLHFSLVQLISYFSRRKKIARNTIQ